MELIRTILDCFNPRQTRAKGQGLFSGAGRFEMFARKLPDAIERGVDREGRYAFDRFYSRLLQIMQWPNPPLAAEREIWKKALEIEPDRMQASLDYLRANAPAVVGFACVGHVELREQTEAEIEREAKKAGEARYGRGQLSLGAQSYTGEVRGRRALAPPATEGFPQPAGARNAERPRGTFHRRGPRDVAGLPILRRTHSRRAFATQGSGLAHGSLSRGPRSVHQEHHRPRPQGLRRRAQEQVFPQGRFVKPIEHVGYLAHAASRAFRAREEATKTLIREHSRYAVSVSWGKDSTAMLALASESLDEVLCVNARYPNPNERFADMDRVRDEVLAKLPNVRYLEATPPGEWEMYERAGEFFVEPMTPKQREAARWWRTSFEAAMREAQEKIGAAGVFMGLGARESFARRLNYLVRGDSYERGDGLRVALPLSSWSARDVWAVLVSRELPWLRVYDVAFEGRERARSGFVFATGGKDPDIARRFGAWESHKLAYPDEFQAWCDKFPEMAMLA